MCVNCVAQGVVYVGGAVGTLEAMAARARHRRTSEQPSIPASPDLEPVDTSEG